MDEVTKKLVEAIDTELSYLNSTAEEEKRAKHIDNVNVLYKLLLEHEKEEDLMSDKSFQRGFDSEKFEAETKLKEKELKYANIRELVGAGVDIGKIVGSGITLGRVMRFEETGVFASKAFQLWSRFGRLF